MDEAKVASQESTLRMVSLTLAVLLPLIVSSEIVDCWHRFATRSKIEAVVLLIILGVEPISFVQAQRRGKLPGPHQVLIFAYTAVLLTMLVFAPRY